MFMVMETVKSLVYTICSQQVLLFNELFLVVLNKNGATRPCEGQIRNPFRSFIQLSIQNQLMHLAPALLYAKRL